MAAATTDRLERHDLVARARVASGLHDLGEVPLDEPLDVLTEALERDARVDGDRRTAVAGTLIGLLVKRLQLVADRARYPDIAREKVAAPIVIVGLPRTGSTHLHALMGCIEGIRVPMFWEQNLPSPPPEATSATTDPRIATIAEMLQAMPPEMLVRHPMSALRPEQCNLLNDWSFMNQALLAYHDIPTYRDWLFGADLTPAYEAHRRTLQHLQWRHPGRWLLKYPKHLLSLDVLLATYPDACLVWTHRDPAVVIPSVCSLTGYIRSTNTPAYDPVRFGREWATIEELALHRGLTYRDAADLPARRLIDVHYRSLMADPIGTVDAICDRFGVPFSAESRDRVTAWIDNHSQTRHGEHRYRAEDFGLTTSGIRRRFDFYLRRFDVEREHRP